MTLFDYCEFFSKVLEKPVYPLQYPFNDGVEDCYTLDVTYGYNLGAGVKSSTVQFQCKSEHPRVAEEKAEELIIKLKNMTNKVHGNYQIIQVRPSFTNPYFLGRDNDYKYMFTVDFVILTNKLDN